MTRKKSGDDSIDLRAEEFMASMQRMLRGRSAEELADYHRTGHLKGDGDTDTQSLATKRVIVDDYVKRQPKEFQDKFYKLSRGKV